MTARPWMPLYIADFLADTEHLDAAQTGAYIRLIMHYWQRGSLPDSEQALALIARMTPAQWKRERKVISAFFCDGWKHKRIDAELAKALDISSKRRASAQQKGSNSSAKAGAKDEHLQTHARGLPQSHSVSKETGASADLFDPEKALFDRGKAILGKSAGGQIVKLLKAKNGSVPLARAALEQASTKQNPGEYIGAVIRGAVPDDPSEARMKVAL